MDLYCDKESCTYHCEGECMRTAVSLMTMIGGHVIKCISYEKKKAPAGLQTVQEHE